jgi:hypothetical protein
MRASDVPILRSMVNGALTTTRGPAFVALRYPSFMAASYMVIEVIHSGKVPLTKVAWPFLIRMFWVKILKMCPKSFSSIKTVGITESTFKSVRKVDLGGSLIVR